MIKTRAKLNELLKAVKEGGVAFHSPGSATVTDLIRAPKSPAHEGGAFVPNDNHYRAYNALPHQKQLLGDLGEKNYAPDAGQTLAEYHGHTGMHTKGNNAFVHDVLIPKERTLRTYLSKKNIPLEPHERKDWHIDDRKMSIAQREVAYHNMAHSFFGMGEHVPSVVLHQDPKDPNQHYSVQEWHHGHDMGDKVNLRKRLGSLHEQGHFPKMAVMDAVLGNKDRHMGNVLFDRHSDSAKWIDNGMTFPASHRVPVPAYYTADDFNHQFNTKMPDHFRSWVKGLDPEKMKKIMVEHGVPDEEQGFALQRLEKARAAAANPKNIGHGDFFRELAKRF